MEFLKRACEMPARTDGVTVDRRRFLAAGGAAAGSSVLLPMSTHGASDPPASMITRGSRLESSFVFYADPLEHQRASWRILRNLSDDADVLFWYHFTMFAVPAGQRPEPVVRWEGIEFSHHRKLRDGVYRVHGHNLSFPRDLRTGRWTSQAVNPISGAMLSLAPMVLTEDPGYVYTLEGVVPLDDPEALPRARYEQFLVEDDLVKIEQVRLAPASWPATFVETSCNWSSRRLFEDPEIRSLPAGTAGGYVFPWPAWMRMDERPGHMFATWNGRKLEGVEQLPAEFVRRAEPEHDHLLAVDLAVFDAPLPEPLAVRYAGGSAANRPGR